MLAAGSVEGIIATARTLLVPIRVEDAAEMAEVLGAPELYEFIGGRPPMEAELTARYARQVIGHSPDGRQDWYNWVIRLRADGRAVGTAQATVVEEGRHADVAWIVGLPWQHQGYGSEAATALVQWLVARGTPYVTAHVHPEHHASATVAARAGLTATGRLDGDGEQVWQRGSRIDE